MARSTSRDTLHHPHRNSSPGSAGPRPLGDPGRTEGEGEGGTPFFPPPNEKKDRGGSPSVVIKGKISENLTTKQGAPTCPPTTPRQGVLEDRDAQRHQPWL